VLIFPGSPHSIVVHVRTTEDVVKVVKISKRYLVPIVPYSGGTSLEGNLSAVRNLLYHMPPALADPWLLLPH